MAEYKSAYCPLCNKVFYFYTDLYKTYCPNCNHHLNLKSPSHYDDFSEDEDETNNL